MPLPGTERSLMPGSVQIVYNNFPKITAALRPAVRAIVRETIFAHRGASEDKSADRRGALRASIQS